MKKWVRNSFSLLATTYKKWNAKDPFRQSAVIAYYTIFSLPGLLVVIITLAGYFFGRQEVNDEIISQISSTMGRDTAGQVQTVIDSASQSKSSVWATILGVATILIGATGVFQQLQVTLNLIWEVEPKKTKSSLWKILRARLLSFGLIITMAFILMVSLLVSAGIAALGDWIEQYFSESFLILLHVVNFIISLFILTVLFAFMFIFLPDAKVKWRHVWVGAMVTAVLFETGKFALTLIFGQSHPGSAYGAAGSVILILAWASYSSLIVFFGAEFTHVYAARNHAKMPPQEHAVKQKPVTT